MKQEHLLILNQKTLNAREKPGLVLVDLIRNNYDHKGTKISCREGDCGSCTILLGEIKNNNLVYKSITSCISPWLIGSGKHIVTIEGLSDRRFYKDKSNGNPIQNIFTEFGATQCGYCTPGFILSLTEFFLTSEKITLNDAIDSIHGNICRCTGYKSIERAIISLVESYQNKIDLGLDRIEALIELSIIPEYFRNIYAKLVKINNNQVKNHEKCENTLFIGGGTDLWVQKPDELLANHKITIVENRANQVPVFEKSKNLVFSANCTIEEIRTSPLVKIHFPELATFLLLFASKQIRQQATLAGNIVNASPIGDMSNFLLAMNAELHLEHKDKVRTILLSNFYKAYKKMDLRKGELIKEIYLPLPSKDSFISLEKVSRRKLLDIASVNTFMHIKIKDNTVYEAYFSAGGISATPLLLKNMATNIKGKEIEPANVKRAVDCALKEISPISDVRGSKSYKSLLLRQLLYAHFIKCFPSKIKLEDLL